MTRGRVGAVVLVLSLLVGTAAQAETGKVIEDSVADIEFMATASSVMSKGGPGRISGSYTLELEYHPSDPTVNHKALLVYAEPSHTLLLVAWNGDLDSPGFNNDEYRAFVETGGALAASVGPHGASHPRVHVVYDPTEDTHIAVSLLDEHMQERVVSSPKVAEDGSFGLTTFFQEGGGQTEGTRYKHCCNCGDGDDDCGTMCIYCWTPRFERSCLWPTSCEIICGWGE